MINKSISGGREGGGIMSGSFTIQVSPELVKKLQSESEKIKRSTRKPKPKPKPKSPRVPQKEQPQNQTPLSDDSKKLQSPFLGGWPLQPPLYSPTITTPQHSSNPEIDAIYASLKESENVLERLQKQEANMLHEVTERAKELHDKEFKIPTRKPMPCLVENDAWLNCYKEHVKDPSKCAQLVRDFSNCVRKARQEFGSEN